VACSTQAWVSYPRLAAPVGMVWQGAGSLPAILVPHIFGQSDWA
jgi:hypothetical protein